MSETLYGNGETIEAAVQDAIADTNTNAANGEVTKIFFDQGGVRGGTEFRVEVRVG